MGNNIFLEDYYWYWLCNISGIGQTKIRNLLKTFDTPEQVYKAKEELLYNIEGLNAKDIKRIKEAKLDTGLYNDYVNLKDKGITFMHPAKEGYPKRLLEIYDYPHSLYYYGRLPEDNNPSVAIVGSRQCSTYGYNIAKSFAGEFAKMGIQVISGLAAGIDGAAHKGVLEKGGYTCGVLGCGVDICYPRSNIEIFYKMKQSGCVVSEYALGTPARAGQFPVRNRIISAFSDAVIVVEARKKSGSLITVDQALEQNKDVFVVPGRIGDSLSEGCNELIRMGAMIITKPQDILESNLVKRKLEKMSLKNEIKMPQENKNIVSGIPEYQQKQASVQEFKLATPKNMLYSCVDLYPTGINDLVIKTGLPVQTISKGLIELQLEGKIQEVTHNYYIRASL